MGSTPKGENERDKYAQESKSKAKTGTNKRKKQKKPEKERLQDWRKVFGILKELEVTWRLSRDGRFG